jgi:transposase
LEKRLKYHRFEEVQTEEVRKRGKKGRMKKAEAPKEIKYKVRAILVEDEEKIEKVLHSKGKFIIATNELDKEKLSNERLFFAYKKEQSSVERGFRFLKDPLFFAKSFFLQKEERIMALTMVMGLCLLVYALAEYKLRRELEEREETIQNQVGKEVQNPTMRWVFQLFEGIDVLYYKVGKKVERMVLNMKEIHRKILSFLGEIYQEFYLCIGWSLKDDTG